MANVRMPDGVVVAFPDQFSKDQIKGFIAAKFPDKFPDITPEMGARLRQGLSQQPPKFAPGVKGYNPESGQVDKMGAGGTYLNSVAPGVPVLGPALDKAQNAGAAAIGSMVTGDPFAKVYKQIGDMVDVGREENRKAAALGNLTGAAASMVGAGATAPGRYILGDFGASVPARMLAGGAANTGLGMADRAAHGEDITDGMKTDALLGAAFPLAAPVARTALRTVSPFVTSPQNVRAANLLRQAGIDLTTGQRTGSKAARVFEEEMGGRALHNFTERQQEDFTRKMLQGANPAITEGKATEDVFSGLDRHFEDSYRNVGSRNHMVPDTSMFTDLRDIAKRYLDNTNPSQRIPAVVNALKDVWGRGRTGVLTGDAYNSIRSGLLRSAREQADPNARRALSDLAHSLDDAMERSIAVVNPGDLGAYKLLRSQYRHFLAVEKAAGRAGGEAAGGTLTPQAMASAMKKIYGEKGWNRGATEQIKIAKAANMLMYPMNNSNTAMRLAARGLIHSPASIAGAVTGYNEAGGGLEGLAGGLAGAFGGRLVNRAVAHAILSRPARRYLGNQVAAPLIRKLGG